MYLQAHPNHEKYLNKKIKMYEEMTIVVEKDIATGLFAKSFIDIQCDVKIEVDSTLLDDGAKFEEIVKGISSTTVPSSQIRSHKKSDPERVRIKKLAMQIKEIILVIKNLNKDCNV